MTVHFHRGGASCLAIAGIFIVLCSAPAPAQARAESDAAAIAAGPAAGSREAVINLDEYYSFPISIGAEYEGLTAFSSFASGFGIRDIAAELRVPIPGAPVLQPFVRGGVISFTETGSSGAGKWDHADYYGAIGLSYTRRFARNFEIGLDAYGGLAQSSYPNLVSGGAVGSLDLLGSLGAVISLVPSFNFGVDIRPSVRYLATLGPLTEFDGFSFGLGFRVGYRFGEDPDAPASSIRSLRFGSEKLPPAFAAMQSYYAQNPIGTVKMTNSEGFPITDLEVSFFQPGYMDSPTPVTTIPSLAPGQETEIGVLAAFNQEVFRTEGTTPLAGELIVKYRSRGKPVEQRHSLSYDLYDKTAIVWDDDRKVGAFITPSDSALRNYVSFIRQSLKQQMLPSLNGALQTAAEVYVALSRLGIIYQSDPTSPFTQVQGNALMVDSVNLARDTLKRGTGDCDDLTVLFTSLLETTGIETGFITVPGHIYAAFNTKVSSRDFRDISPDRDLTIALDGELWIPVEITMIGKQGFLDAWHRGAELWKQYDGDAAKRRFTLTGVAQKTFRPVGLREMDLGLQYGRGDALVAPFRQELSSLGESVTGDLADAAKASGDKKDYNYLGIALARFGRNSEAEAAFARALAIDPSFVSARVNQGNVSYIQKDYRKALSSYQAALAALASQGKTQTQMALLALLDISRTYNALHNPAEAQNALAKAQSIDPERARDLGYLAQTGAEGASGARAAEQSDAVPFLSEE